MAVGNLTAITSQPQSAVLWFGVFAGTAILNVFSSSFTSIPSYTAHVSTDKKEVHFYGITFLKMEIYLILCVPFNFIASAPLSLNPPGLTKSLSR